MLGNVLAAVTIAATLAGATAALLAWRAAHTADLRRVVVILRELAQEIVAVGGVDAPRFLADDIRRTEQELGDLLGRLNDKTLRTHATTLRDAHRRTFASAPAERGPRMYVMPGPPDPAYEAEDRQRAAQHNRQVDAAHETLAAAEAALGQINRLERFLWRKA